MSIEIVNDHIDDAFRLILRGDDNGFAEIHFTSYEFKFGLVFLYLGAEMSGSISGGSAFKNALEALPVQPAKYAGVSA